MNFILKYNQNASKLTTEIILLNLNPSETQLELDRRLYVCQLISRHFDYILT